MSRREEEKLGRSELSDAAEQEDREDLGPFPRRRLLRSRQGWWVDIATPLESGM